MRTAVGKPRRGLFSRLGLWALVGILGGAACGEDSPTSPPPPAGNQRPVAAFTTDVMVGSSPLTVQFDGGTSTDPDGSVASYAWDFGDGNTGSGQTTSHVYGEPGPYTPRLTVADDRGATNTRVGDRINVNSPPGTGSNDISGIVYHDADADGSQGSGELGIPALIVFLDENDDGIQDSGEVVAVTDDSGAFQFSGLESGQSYTVTQALPVGWTNTSPGAPGGVPPLPSGLEPNSGNGHASLAAKAKVIGGSVATEGEFPFQVALVTTASQFQFCGGSFIARSWVLTAAHCVTGAIDDITDPSQFQIFAGSHDLNSGGELIDATRVLVHPSFSASGFVSSDIALVELDGEFMYPRTELLTPADENLALPGTNATVIGWGLTSNNGSGSDVLKKLSADIISNAECQTLLGNNILSVTICAGMQGASESICNGDSGGPLMVPYRNRWMQVGIVSFGANICFQPTAYARVSALVDYVESNVPVERSGAVTVDWSGGSSATVSFGNFR
ncbi:MAG: trypsin-like serine protease [Longimicrobiales bacterium]